MRRIKVVGKVTSGELTRAFVAVPMLGMVAVMAEVIVPAGADENDRAIVAAVITVAATQCRIIHEHTETKET